MHPNNRRLAARAALHRSRRGRDEISRRLRQTQAPIVVDLEKVGKYLEGIFRTTTIRLGRNLCELPDCTAISSWNVPAVRNKPKDTLNAITAVDCNYCPFHTRPFFDYDAPRSATDDRVILPHTGNATTEQTRNVSLSVTEVIKEYQHPEVEAQGFLYSLPNWEEMEDLERTDKAAKFYELRLKILFLHLVQLYCTMLAKKSLSFTPRLEGEIEPEETTEEERQEEEEKEYLRAKKAFESFREKRMTLLKEKDALTSNTMA
ncbi:hypothetical protein BJ508DRAFT_378812 [Ascobolus immersus RN42]|uniref:Uncharacterized protein n=1 Tax=Ascobolus immersus RN42 TaxID=1160509 RepID=A0A3N4HWU7_ASCIM|nr:hypothetical protein BJ508DRAFT_378812 [Ascobolus immersus RN42]